MTRASLAARRLASQRLASPAFTTPAEVVRWFGAMQAQDYLASLWAVGSRMQATATEDDVEQAIANRAIVRSWPMRGTVHLTPAEDARWMVRLLTPRVMQRVRRSSQKLGLDEDVLSRSRKVFVRALEGGRQQTRAALYALLEAEGIATANSRGLHIIGYLAHQGLVCYGPRAGKQPTLTLLDEITPYPRDLTGDEALAELALRYFRSHGPATIHDFMWWSGLRASEARVGIQAAGSHLAEETIAGKTYWWTGAPPAGPQARPPRAPALSLLPAFDEYMVGYKDRSPALETPDEWLRAAENHLRPIVIIDGQVAGGWKRSFKNGEVVIETTHLRRLSPAESQALESAARRYGQFLGLPASLRTG